MAFRREELEQAQRIDEAKLTIETQKVMSDNSRLELERQMKLQELEIKKDALKEETRRQVFTSCIAQGMTAAQIKEYLAVI